MKFVTSILNRRAFAALAAASMLAGVMHSAPVSAADATIPIIVKDTTSFYWQIVLAGARKAGKDLGVDVPELGAQAETDVNGQISNLENAVFKGRSCPVAQASLRQLAAPQKGTVGGFHSVEVFLLDLGFAFLFTRDGEGIPRQLDIDVLLPDTGDFGFNDDRFIVFEDVNRHVKRLAFLLPTQPV